MPFTNQRSIPNNLPLRSSYAPIIQHCEMLFPPATTPYFRMELTTVLIFFLSGMAFADTSSLPPTNLKAVSITDSTSNNQPPSAIINHTQDGGSFTFNAGASSDPDGSITEYRWNFGDGTSGKGATITHQFVGGSFPVTLTVVDDKGGVDIAQYAAKIVTPGEVGNLVASSAPKYISPTQIWAYKLPATPVHNGALKSISITADGGGSNRRFKLCLYSHDPVNNLPGELVVDSVTIEGIASGNTPQLVTVNIEKGAPQIKAGAQYWIGIQAQDKYFGYYKDYDATGLIVYKTVPVYNWGSWEGKADGVLNYRIGKCFFTYEY